MNKKLYWPSSWFTTKPVSLKKQSSCDLCTKSNRRMFGINKTFVVYKIAVSLVCVCGL